MPSNDYTKYYFLEDIRKGMGITKNTVCNWFKNYLDGIVFVYNRKTLVPDYYLEQVIKGEKENIKPGYKLIALQELINSGEIKPLIFEGEKICF